MRTDTALALDGPHTNAALADFLLDAEARGVIDAAELETLQLDHELDDETVEELRATLVANDVEIEESAPASEETATAAATSTCARWASCATACSSS